MSEKLQENIACINIRKCMLGWVEGIIGNRELDSLRHTI